MKFYKPGFLICIIVAIGAIVRIIGINFGLPFIYHNDESVIVNYALAFGAGDLNPHFFKLPPLPSYILFFAYGIYFCLGNVLGFFSSLEDFGILFINNPSSFFLIGRILLGFIPGVFSIYLIYKLANKCFSKNTALLSALFLSINFLHVRDSHYAYTDITVTLLIISFFIMLYNIFQNENIRFYFYTGFLFGVAVSIKYNAIFLIFPLTLVILFNGAYLKKYNLRKFIKKIFVFGFSVLVALFITNPFMFLDYANFMKSTSSLPLHSSQFWSHFKVSILGSIGLPMALASLGGIFLTFLKKKTFFIIMLLYCTIYYYALTIASQLSPRYIFPILPVFLMSAAFFTDYLLSFIKIKRHKFFVCLAAIFLLVGVACLKIYYLDKLFIQKDTRTLAYEWVISHCNYGEKIAIDATGPIFPVFKKIKSQIIESSVDYENKKFKKPKGALDFKVKLLLKDSGHEKYAYELYFLRTKLNLKRFLGDYPQVPLDVKFLRKIGVKYVVLNNIIQNSGMHKDFLTDLEKNAALIQKFSPYKRSIIREKIIDIASEPAAAFSLKELRDRERFGPVLKIYQFKISS